MKRGDVVQMKAGGPKMTVTSVDRKDPRNVAVAAVWFDREDRYHWETFFEECLDLCSEEPVHANGVTQPQSDFMKHIQLLELSHRSKRVFRYMGVKTVGDLVVKTERELLRAEDFGRKSLNEVKDVLSQMGLYLGMDAAAVNYQAH